jgi:hypothetical protein
MNDAGQITIQDALQKLMQYGLKECAEEVRDQCDRACLYAFERLDDESGLCYGCETEDDVFTLLSLMEVAEKQYPQ